MSHKLLKFTILTFIYLLLKWFNNFRNVIILWCFNSGLYFKHILNFQSICRHRFLLSETLRVHQRARSAIIIIHLLYRPPSRSLDDRKRGASLRALLWKFPHGCIPATKARRFIYTGGLHRAPKFA